MRHMSNAPRASASQVSFIRNLLVERQAALGIEDVDAFMAEQGIELLTGGRGGSASQLIEKLKQVPRVAPDPTAVALPGPENAYPGNCFECKGHVPARAGWRSRNAGQWVVHHAPGQCHEVTVTNVKPDSDRVTELLAGIEDGYFALPCKTGSNDLDFIRVGTNQGRAVAADKGKRRVQRYLGGQGPVAIFRNEQVIFAEALAAMTPEQRLAAQHLFGQSVGNCCRCGRTLTDQVSRAEGVGPECRGKL
jgi:hypothetical protein